MVPATEPTVPLSKFESMVGALDALYLDWQDANRQITALRVRLAARSEMWHKSFGPPHVSEWATCPVPVCSKDREALRSSEQDSAK